MRTRLPLLVLVLCLTQLVGAECNLHLFPKVLSPARHSAVSDFSFLLVIEVPGGYAFNPAVGVTINSEVVPVNGSGPLYTALMTPGGPLRDVNAVEVRSLRLSDNLPVTARSWFRYLPPKARAFAISHPAQLITGPLAHGRVGDYMLANGVARFVIQDVSQRDLYSVGQYGGNLIDADVVGKPGLDNFLEVQPGLNIETVINADEITILNDGQNGLPAQIETCGFDDLLDFVNPSSQVIDAGIPFPAILDDNDMNVRACTTYTLEPGNSYVRMDTEIFNNEPVQRRMIVGDWMNQSGELDVMLTPNAGLGSAVFNTLGAMSFHGFGEAAGVDYSYTTVPAAFPAGGKGSYITISGVTVILHNMNAVLALIGFPSFFVVPPGGSKVMTRYFGVGDGSPSNAIDLENEVKSVSAGTLKGCVTVAGTPAPAAKVSVGTLSGGAIESLLSSFITDAAGCYEGSVPAPDAPGDSYGVAAARQGTPYVGGGSVPPVTLVNITPGGTATADFDLPQTGSIKVTSVDAGGDPIPARVTVVGFDTSPEPTVPGPSLPIPGFGSADLGLFNDVGDGPRFGIVHVAYTGAGGEVEFDIEPAADRYHVYVSRGTEYSLFRTANPVSVAAGAQTQIAAQIAHVLDTEGFVSSDFHVHGINSADSRVSHRDRVLGYAGDGVDNIIMTDHHAHTDLDPTIASLGLGDWLDSTIGEEITTFDYGHFNAYPLLVDSSRVSGGSTDWAQAAPPGQDFPSFGALNATPAEIYALATAGSTSTPDTTIQINHIGSHFEPLAIDTALVPPQDGLDDIGRANRRLPSTGAVPNLFHHFPALELWNGSGRGAQRQFLAERLGIWFNLLNQGLDSTLVADTDSHKFSNLNSAGARTWTAASPGSDAPGDVLDGEIAGSIDSGKATVGQGLFVTTRLLATDGSGDVADLTWGGDTNMSDANGNVELEIAIQAPLWAEYDTIEVYYNAATTPVDPGEPYLYGATPTLPPITGFAVDLALADGTPVLGGPPYPLATRRQTLLTLPVNGLTGDTWFVVVVKGTDGTSQPMFPVFPHDLSRTFNTNLADLVDGNLGEGGVLALGATNALYFVAPGP